ncbi:MULTISPECIES: response regulator transcription factor [Burkholderia]|uniref:response regulator transcription factor n=1 Tax=Burkholderia TaxID=32008 RepID=UPI001C27AA42|nr:MULTISPECIES: response regulator transcription factor [Burkholderia]MBU9385633.1 response regulator transcription factor [Burkholderia gladioli]MDN7429059.1 response regulator transcription factor [Burkholderia sp. AU45388]MDN7922660.1 response regulator transcription factor [Burkholderia gladioli]
MVWRVVIADDHPIVLLGCRLLLEQGGMKVTGEASHSGELMSILARVTCDVLITDFSMPGTGHADGLAMLAAIRREYAMLPVIVLTNIANAGLLRATLNTGVLGIVEKGAKKNELFAAIHAAMSGAVYISIRLQRELAEIGLSSTESQTAARLTARELEVLRLLAIGKSPAEVGRMLHRTIKTVSWAKMSAKRKLGLKSDAELYEYVVNLGLNG